MHRAQGDWLGDWGNAAGHPSDETQETHLPVHPADDLAFGADLTFLPPDLGFDSPFHDRRARDEAAPGTLDSPFHDRRPRDEAAPVDHAVLGDEDPLVEDAALDSFMSQDLPDVHESQPGKASASCMLWEVH